MRIRLFYIAIMLIAALGTSAQIKKELTILHTSDAHSCIYPLSKNLADTMLADRGGFLRRINMLKEERKEDPNVLLLDCGDFSQGSPYYTLFKGDVEVSLMNQMGYDAATIGNHEFDYGLENMIRLFKMCKFPIVCSNYDFTGTEAEGIVKEYIIIKRNGLKIGIFGLSPQLEGLVAADNYRGVTYHDPITTANRMTNLLKGKEKCDVVICLSHLGWSKDPDYMGDQKVIRSSHGIDLVLGGHSHTFQEYLEYEKDAAGKPVPFDHQGKHSIFVGKIKMQFK